MPNETQDTQSETQQPASDNATGVAEPTVDQLQARVAELEAQAGIYQHLFAHYNKGLDLATESQWVRASTDSEGKVTYDYRASPNVGSGAVPSSTESGQQVPTTVGPTGNESPPPPVGSPEPQAPQLKVVPATPPSPAKPVQGQVEKHPDEMSDEEFIRWTNESLAADRNKQDKVSIPAQAVATN